MTREHALKYLLPHGTPTFHELLQEALIIVDDALPYSDQNGTIIDHYLSRRVKSPNGYGLYVTPTFMKQYKLLLEDKQPIVNQDSMTPLNADQAITHIIDMAKTPFHKGSAMGVAVLINGKYELLELVNKLTANTLTPLVTNKYAKAQLIICSEGTFDT